MARKTVTPILDIRGISKAFGPVQALNGVSLQVNRGEIHGLIGENGAGKSTLMKILSGAHSPDSGEIIFNGQPYAAENPAHARQAGIAMIYQELTLAPHLSVEENIMLGREKATMGFIRRQSKAVREVLDWMGHGNLDPGTRVGSLSISMQQVVEIARALAADAKLVIMDEPTSSLTAEDTEALFGILSRLRHRNVSVIYISHFLEEVKKVCDRVTILRDGSTAATYQAGSAETKMLIEAMVGRSMESIYPELTHNPGETILTVSRLKGQPLPDGVDLSLRRGEILGIAGLVGSGRSETLRAVFGLNRCQTGAIHLKDGSIIKAASLTPARALSHEIDLLSENRKEEGLATALSVTMNVTLSALRQYSRAGLLDLPREAQCVTEWCRKLSIKTGKVSDPAASLSGGNQQKVALARLLHHDCDILLLDEPTRGIDIGSKSEIYRLIQQLAAKGKSIIFVSSYIPELLGVCHSLAVMHRGTISQARPIRHWDAHSIMLYATSGRTEKEAA